jgi:hypothetical protein
MRRTSEMSRITAEKLKSYAATRPTCPPLKPLLEDLAELFTQVQRVVKDFYTIEGIVAQVIADMSARTYVKPVIFVRLVWREENTGVYFEITNRFHRLALLDIYFRYNLRSYIDSDPLFKDDMGCVLYHNVMSSRDAEEEMRSTRGVAPPPAVDPTPIPVRSAPAPAPAPQPVVRSTEPAAPLPQPIIHSTGPPPQAAAAPKPKPKPQPQPAPVAAPPPPKPKPQPQPAPVAAPPPPKPKPKPQPQPAPVSAPKPKPPANVITTSAPPPRRPGDAPTPSPLILDSSQQRGPRSATIPRRELPPALPPRPVGPK